MVSIRTCPGDETFRSALLILFTLETGCNLDTTSYLYKRKTLNNNETEAHMNMKTCNYLPQKLQLLLTTVTDVELDIQ